MSGSERYTTTYSSMPQRLTRAYVIPPIESDPHFRDRVGRRNRQESATLSARSVSPTDASERASRSAARVAAAAERRSAAYAAAAQRQAAAQGRAAVQRQAAGAASRPYKAAAPSPAPQAAPRPPQATDGWRRQLRTAIDSGNTAQMMGTISSQMRRQGAPVAPGTSMAPGTSVAQGTPQTPQGVPPRRSVQQRQAYAAQRQGYAAAPAAAGRTPPKKKSALGRVVSIIVVLILLGTVFRPAIEGIIDVFTPDPVPGDSDSQGDPSPPATVGLMSAASAGDLSLELRVEASEPF